MLFVGDSRQAIMHFAGADSRSYYTIQERTDAVELPLSICYRCPTSHIELAQEIVPEIEPAPNAKEGVIRSVDGVSLQDHVGEGDLILCRTTAPLISWCIRLIRNRVAARVRGRDVAANLVSTIKKIGEKTSYDKFGDALDIYYDRQLIKIGKKEGSEAKIQVLDDTVEAIRACWTDFNASGIDDLCQQLTNIFSDYSASVWLSTVHRAKGLEAERVFILHDEKLPLVWRNQKPEQYLQELNLRYVALTRAKSELIFVTPQTSELKGSVSNGRHDESAGEEAQLVSSPQMAIVS